ncbi:hypothetical protein Syun_003338 [Stephania yunnanensis]|uniref:Uncharacterized protein n=1 Tax=Stephania yunnanensis TaxID=152371 RepID=A0AAP0L188_9MAGN
MTDQELELELNEAGRASATPPARSTTCWGFSIVLFGLESFDLSCTYRMFVEDIAFSNCALNMACEILQLELGNMNLRLFGSPGKFYGQAQAHESDRLRQVIEKEMLKVEVGQRPYLVKGSPQLVLEPWVGDLDGLRQYDTNTAGIKAIILRIHGLPPKLAKLTIVESPVSTI